MNVLKTYTVPPHAYTHLEALQKGNICSLRSQAQQRSVCQQLDAALNSSPRQPSREKVFTTPLGIDRHCFYIRLVQHTVLNTIRVYAGSLLHTSSIKGALCTTKNYWRKSTAKEQRANSCGCIWLNYIEF